MKIKKSNPFKIFGFIVLIIVLILGIGFNVYVRDYYKMDESTAKFIDENSGTISNTNGMSTIITDMDSDIGIIFYHGGKVDPLAYVPMLYKLSQQGYNIYIPHMPYNLAVFDIDAASKIIGTHTEIKQWYLMGHSLGGAMASQYTINNKDKVKGLILLGAYPIKATPIETLAIYGTQDIRLETDKLSVLDNEHIVVIDGGNHAYFGNYGEQNGDGIASISREKQQTITVEAVHLFIQNHYQH